MGDNSWPATILHSVGVLIVWIGSYRVTSRLVSTKDLGVEYGALRFLGPLGVLVTFLASPIGWKASPEDSRS